MAEIGLLEEEAQYRATGKFPLNVYMSLGVLRYEIKALLLVLLLLLI